METQITLDTAVCAHELIVLYLGQCPRKQSHLVSWTCSPRSKMVESQLWRSEDDGELSGEKPSALCFYEKENRSSEVAE